MIKYIFLIVTFFLTITTLNAQICENLDAGEDVQMLCTDNEVTLNAVVLTPNFKSTTDYIITEEPLCPSVTYDGSRTFLEIDDAWSASVIDIPFLFCFYENQYDQILVSGNGIVTFDLTVVGQFSQWNTDINDFLGTDGQQNWQTNAIFGAYHDMDSSVDPREDRISYKTEGVAPNRKFIISFDVLQFSCNELLSKSQITLYESSNVIDVRIDEKPVCNGWNEGLAVVGIQNKSGTLSQTGREHGVWTPTTGGELWRFVPNGEDLDYTLIWYDEADINIPPTPLNVDEFGEPNNSETIIVDPQIETTYVIEMIYEDQCSNTTSIVVDTVTVTPGFIPDLEEPIDLTTCEDPIGSGTFDFDIDQTIFVLNGLDAADFIISYHNTLDDVNNNTNPIATLNPYTSGSGTIYIRFEDINDATCSTYREFDLTVFPVLDTSFTYPSTSYCSDDVNPLPNAMVDSETYTINNGGVIDPETGEIDLEASGLGTNGTGVFIIIHEINECSMPTSEFEITILLAEDPNFDYPDTVCISEVTNPIATNIATVGGIFTVDGGATIDATTGELDLSTTTGATIYTINYSLNPGGVCPSELSQTIEILNDDSSFDYLLIAYCDNDANPLPQNIITPGGVFTIDNGGIIDETTGEIDLEASGLGTNGTGIFIVTYTIVACDTLTEFEITITLGNNTDFVYPTEVCIDDTNPVPISIDTPGGVFTVDGGASIDATTGELDLSTITIGSYIITYSFGGDCPSSTPQTINVIAEDDPTFTYLDTLYCSDGTNPLPDFIATADGVFTINNGGVINATTGEVDIIASGQGTNNTGEFTITYTTLDPCSASEDFMIGIIATPIPENFDDVEVCDSYTLPELMVDNHYFSEINGGGIEFFPGNVIETTQIIYIYSETGTVPNCFAENSFTVTINTSPTANTPTIIIDSCNNGDGTANFDLAVIEDEIIGNQTGVTVTYHITQANAENGSSEIQTVPFAVLTGNDIWARIENTAGCFDVIDISPFIVVEQCFLIIPEGFSPNSSIDQNQTFSIEGIRDMFPKFEIWIYNRYGNEVYSGTASTPDWNGQQDNSGNDLPVGTYFYGIKLNDEQQITHRGWVYLQR